MKMKLKKNNLDLLKSEHILQWIWQELLFSTQNLKTNCGKSVQIISQGNLNHTDGPDFSAAEIIIGGMRFYGDVEIHLNPKDWFAHNHHKDSAYNSVILHVFASGKNTEVVCKNGDNPPSLNLLPYLDESLEQLLSGININELPCSSNVKFLSEEVFLKQIEKAHQEYFEKKSSDFLSRFNPSISQSEAWKRALVISIFDGYGIPHNREQMKELAQSLFPLENVSLQELHKRAEEISGFGSNNSSSLISWNHKAVRPANHPKVRIKQALELSHHFYNTPFEEFLSINSIHLWKDYCNSANRSQTNHQKILFATVFLPALYSLAKIFAHTNLSNKVLDSWNKLQSPIPKSLLKPFKNLPYSSSVYSKKLGAIHQLNQYCAPKNCTECLILKSAIQS